MKALSVESATALANRAAAGRALGVVLLFLPEAEGEEDQDAFTMVVCGIIYVRQGGFMVVMPMDETVKETVLAMSQSEDEEPAFFQGRVVVETPRSKHMGEADCYLVDFPWPWVQHFVAGSSARSVDLQAQRALQFRVDGQLLRAGKVSAYSLADSWIASTMPDLVAQDYLTGEEADESDELQEFLGGAPTQGAADQDVTKLQERVRELEALVGQSQSSQPAVPRAGATSKAPALFGAGPPAQTLSTQDWVKLRRLAGPPPKAGQAEARRQRLTAETSAADNSFVALEREVEEDGVNPSLQFPGFDLEALRQSADPMQQLMVSQLQQNQILLQKLIAPRHSDPMFSLLDGGSGSGSGGNSGIRGCLARDAFVTFQRLPRQWRPTLPRSWGFPRNAST